MLQPKRSKFRKQFRGKMKGQAQSGNQLSFGEYGIKATTRGWVSAKHLESARKAIAHHTKRAGKVWIRIFPDKPITKKALGTRMGSGKGDIFDYVAVVTPGRILFELGGVNNEISREALRLAQMKLPVLSKIIVKD
jgi:large subunit ribosomal protein L16